MTNRVTTAVARMKAQIEERVALGLTTPARVRRTGRDLDMGLDEYARFQTLKSDAALNGKLTLEEGQTVYAYLGETLAHYNRQPVYVKYVLNGLFQELLRADLARRGVRV